MTWEITLKAFAATYLISTVIFMICTYMNLGEKFDRITYVLMWPLFITLVALNVILSALNDAVYFLLTAIWPEEADDDDDFDEDGGFA